MVLTTILWNAIRVWTAISWHNILIEFSVSISTAASAVLGGFWVIIFCILYWSIRQKKSWAGKMLLSTAASYTFLFWSERLFFQNPRPNTVFAVIVNLGLLITVYFAYKSLSREAYERKIENPGIE